MTSMDTGLTRWENTTSRKFKTKLKHPRGTLVLVEGLTWVGLCFKFTWRCILPPGEPCIHGCHICIKFCLALDISWLQLSSTWILLYSFISQSFTCSSWLLCYISDDWPLWFAFGSLGGVARVFRINWKFSWACPPDLDSKYFLCGSGGHW